MRKVFKFQGQAPHLVPHDTKVLAVRLQQANNKRTNVLVIYKGKVVTLAQASAD